MTARRHPASRTASPLLATLLLLAAPGRDLAGGQEPQPDRFSVDDAAMAMFEPWLGTWGPPPGSELDYRAVFEWGIPGKTVRFTEYDLREGALVRRNECLIGYHYGRQRVEFLEFVRDDPARDFEVMNEGWYELRDDGALIRRFRSFDPDTSSREYRETRTIEDDGSRLHTIEYRDDQGAWRPWPRGPFRTVRHPELEVSTAPSPAPAPGP